MPRFLTVDEVLYLHSTQLEQFGGQAGVRDIGLLEAAVAMPTARFGDQFLHNGLAAMAGAYLFHISRNHSFLDGNKRAATAAALTFLRVNGITTRLPLNELTDLSLAVAAGNAGKDEAIAFFQKYISGDH